MSQENVESVRTATAAWNRGDLDAFLKDVEPNVVIRPDPSWPESRLRLGSDAARSFFEDLTEMLGPAETVIDELVDAGDRVVCRFRTRVHGRQSAIEEEFVFTRVRTFRRGKTIMIEFFLDHQEALEAAGLRE
jgi:ketosteroid isomerase-like protein